jgi:signal transduction histidine kinase
VARKSKSLQIRTTARAKRRPDPVVRAAAAGARRDRADAKVAYLSHEARNTLSAILGFCDLIDSEAMGPVGNATYRQYIRHIKTSADHLSLLLDDSLELVGSNAPQMHLNESCVRVGEVVYAAVTMTQGLADKAGVHLGFAATDGDLRLFADSTKIRQIVLNLLSNAIKYTRPGGRVGVAIRHAREGGVAIVVSDTGIGMSQSEVGRTFTPFVRHSGARTLNRPGSGLGLFLTRRMVAAHQGRIEIASEPGRGTSVSVTFPTSRVARCVVCACPMAKVA